MADITLVQGDTGPDIEATLRRTRDRVAINLTTATSVRFQLRHAESRRFAVDAEADIVNPLTGTVRYEFVEGDLAQWGDYIAQWEIHWDTGKVQTTTPAGTVEVRRQ